jgi:hypothetical protein
MHPSMQRPISSPVRPCIRRQVEGVSWGEAGAGGATRDATAAAPATYLATPSPGAPNAGPMASGPFVFK